MANRFDIWLKTGKPGSEFIYHTGTSLSKHGEGLEFSDLVYSARESFDRGEITLVQRRLTHGRRVCDIGRFAWVAVKLAVPKRPKQWITKDGAIASWVERPERRARGR